MYFEQGATAFGHCISHTVCDMLALRAPGPPCSRVLTGCKASTNTTLNQTMSTRAYAKPGALARHWAAL
eukprot:1149523-Pelagomonas_calceolata.AAC.10